MLFPSAWYFKAIFLSVVWKVDMDMNVEMGGRRILMRHKGKKYINKEVYATIFIYVENIIDGIKERTETPPSKSLRWKSVIQREGRDLYENGYGSTLQNEVEYEPDTWTDLDLEPTSMHTDYVV